MLSMHDNEQYFFGALKAGACGYVLAVRTGVARRVKQVAALQPQGQQPVGQVFQARKALGLLAGRQDDQVDGNPGLAPLRRDDGAGGVPLPRLDPRQSRLVAAGCVG